MQHAIASFHGVYLCPSFALATVDVLHLLFDVNGEKGKKNSCIACRGPILRGYTSNGGAALGGPPATACLPAICAIPNMGLSTAQP